jgi:uncharacterized protein YaaR (DUF327 family)
MKISESTNQRPELLQAKKTAKGRAKAGSSSRSAEAPDFAQALTGTAEGHMRLALDQLMEKLDEQGGRLVRYQTFDELERYKSLVAVFLDKLVNQLYKLKLADGEVSARRRVNVTLEKLDLGLEALTKELLSRQKSALRILEKLGQIKGLLLDLYK